MSTITTRSGKGSPLTHDEVDSNFTNLNTDKYESGDSPSFAGLTVASDSTYAIDVSRPSAGNTTLRITGGSTAGNDSIFRADIGNTTGTSAVYFGDSTTNGIGRIMYEHNGDYMRFYTSSTEKMRITSTGNVGIGTTSPAVKLHVSSTGTPIFRIQDADGSDYYAQISQATGNTIFDTRFGASNGAFIFRGLGGGTADEYMRITSAGNVGIGTTSPTSSKLHIDGGDLRIQDVTPNIYFYSEGAVNNVQINANISDAAQGGIAILENGNTLIQSRTNYTQFYSANTERMRITSSGNVGIGTSSPLTKLVTVGTTMATSQAFVGSVSDTSYSGGIINLSNSSRSIGITSDPTNAGASSILNFSVDGSERMRIDSSGDVLIGTTIDSGALTINADSNSKNNRALHLEITDDDPTAATTATYIDYNISGATATGGDTNHVALRLDTDSTATGGNTTDEHRVYGIYNTVDVSGDSDAVYGVYNDIRANHSAGTMSVLYGNYTLLEADNSGGTVATATANRNLMYVNGTGSTSNAYANTNITLLQNPSTVINAIGGYNEVQLESNSTVSTVYGVRSIIDENGGNSTNEYLFHASYEGTPSGSGYGLYINGETKNYISGNVGIGTSSPAAQLDVVGTVRLTNTANASNNSNIRDGGGLVVESGNSNPLYFYTGGSERMRIDSSGKVGIGTVPSYGRLHIFDNNSDINMSANAHGQLHIDGNGYAFGIALNSSGANLYTNAVSRHLIFGVNETEVMRVTNVDLKFNSGYGSVATAYGCRAWVNFNGTGTVSIRESGNVSSITDSGTGNYTVNFTTSMPDVNYSAVCSGFRSAGNEAVVVPDSFVTGGVGVNCTTGGGGEVDFSKVCVAVFR